MSNITENIELLWIEKEKQTNDSCYKFEKKEEYCYGINNSNILIHGDNLGAMKLLKKDYTEKIKCVYIDPPYNSLIDFQHYSDKYTHSEWLDMMYQRLLILKELLTEDGYIFVQIDNRELHYLKIIMDEIFGRENYRNSIIVRKCYDAYTLSDRQDVFKTGYDTLLLYSKNISCSVPFIFKENSGLENKGIWKDFWCIGSNGNNYKLFGIDPENGSWRWTEVEAFTAIGNYKQLIKHIDSNNLNNESFEKVYFEYIRTNDISIDLFSLIRIVNGRLEYYIPPTDNYILGDDWTDIVVQGAETNFEHEVNEDLLFRIISNFTEAGDIVLDAFLGSATSAAVAQKLNRKWIGIEYGEHCYSHCMKRINNIIDIQKLNNEDNETCGYDFYELIKVENNELENVGELK